MWKKYGRYAPGRKHVEAMLSILHAGGDVQEQTRLYYREKQTLLLKLLFAGLVCSLALLIASRGEPSLEEGRFLTRQERSYTQELELWVDGRESQSIQVEVEPRMLTEEESRQLLEKTAGKLEELILGENTSLDEVRSDLNLLTEVEGTPVCISWELDSYAAMNGNGTLREDNLAEEGNLVMLTAQLTCCGESMVYQCAVRVLPPILQEEERFWQELKKALAQTQEESRESSRKILPETVDGKILVWKEPSSKVSVWVLLLTAGCIPLLYVAKDRDLKQQMKEREAQMKRDYARIVSKLVLLMGAGAGIRNAWEQIVRDYKLSLEQGSGEIRYAYEEMALALREMQNGRAEGFAYEQFGLRCRVPCYMKLAALLEQNLKKGNKGLTALLRLEVQEAFEQRAELARRKGEEAATKLLLPMILLLLLILLLILAPAMMSMQM